MEKTKTENRINNQVYQQLGERWYKAKDDPIALLRAESRFRNPWIGRHLCERYKIADVLDVGCGAGFLANELARYGHRVTGLDRFEEPLQVARKYDGTGQVDYQAGDAYELPFANQSFDAICAMDFLEHIEEPRRFLSEVSRVLRPFGMFFFATFNRNIISHLVVIKGVEWFVKNTPRDLHVIDYFIKPRELKKICSDAGLQFGDLHGVRPNLISKAGWKMLRRGEVEEDFSFSMTRSTTIGYMGFATKQVL